MKIQIISDYGGQKEVYVIQDYCEHEIFETGESGQLESIEKVNENMALAFGRLVNTLCERGVLEAQEVVNLFGRYPHNTGKFVTEKTP